MGALSAVEPLSPSHDVSAFASDESSLDDWLRRRALKSEGLFARTYVVHERGRVIGYHALVAGSVQRENATGSMRRNAPDPVPVVMLGRLAVDRSAQGGGIGTGLLKDALRRVAAASEIIGVRAVMVHAIDEKAASFYRRFGFKAVPGESMTLFLPLQAIATAPSPPPTS